MERASFETALRRSWIVSGEFGLTRVRSTASASIVVRSPTRVRRWRISVTPVFLPNNGTGVEVSTELCTRVWHSGKNKVIY